MQAIAIQWSKMFHKAHLHKKKSFRLGEGAVIETIGENSRRIVFLTSIKQKFGVLLQVLLSGRDRYLFFNADF